MPTTRGDTFIGSITYNTGTANQERWLHTDNAGQKARTLITSTAGPDPVTVDNMIKTDRTGFTNLALHIKTVKTVSGQADIDFTVRRLYFWGGLDETHWCNLTYSGVGTHALYARAGSIAASFGSQIDLNAAQLVLDNMAVNAVGAVVVNFTAGAEVPWIVPWGMVGVFIQLQTAATPAITTSNTWTVELTWFYA
jgi:hypothetical protein